MRLSALLAISVFSVTPTLSTALADEFEAKSAVTEAVVFPSGASLTRSAAFEVPAGRHTVLLAGLIGGGLDENSLRASGSGDQPFTILSVEMRRPDPETLARRMESAQQKWQQARERLEDQKRGAQNAKQAAERQLRYIDAAIEAASLSGEDQYTAPRAADWSALWRDSARAAQEALAAQQRADQLIRNIDRQLRQLPPPNRRAEQDIAVAVEIQAAAPVSGNLEVEYFHNAASWYPVYDARLATVAAKPSLTLQRRAAVSQNTQEDWRDVALTLSTARPSGRTAAIEPRSRTVRLVPEMRPDFGMGAVGGYAAGASFDAAMAMPSAAPVAEMMMLDSADVMAKRNSATVIAAQQAVAQIQQLGETVIYKIPARADIPAGNRSRRILIGESPLDISMQLRATPSQDETAYLYAAFKNDGALILPGEASLVKDDVFIGRAQLKAIAPGEKGAIPFGPVETLKLAYRVTEQKDADSFGRPQQSYRFRSETRIENLGRSERLLRIYEAIPTTQDEDVEITLVSDQTPTEIDAEDKTGRLVWEIALEPGEETTLGFGYDIDWPFGRELIGR